MKALGATNRQVMSIFLVEATILAGLGGLLGLALGFGGSVILRHVIPALDATPPAWSAAAALATALGVGIVFGLMPARRASKVDPVIALAKGKA
jgi:putative ABC transport system permease protein